MEDIRDRIDRIDDALVQRLADREALVRRAAAFKTDAQAVRASDRVGQVITRVRGLALDKGASPDLVERVYRTMIEAFIDLELGVAASPPHTTTAPSHPARGGTGVSGSGVSCRR